MSCVMPCSRTWSATFFTSGQSNGVPSLNKPMSYSDSQLSKKKKKQKKIKKGRRRSSSSRSSSSGNNVWLKLLSGL